MSRRTDNMWKAAARVTALKGKILVGECRTCGGNIEPRSPDAHTTEIYCRDCKKVTWVYVVGERA